MFYAKLKDKLKMKTFNYILLVVNLKVIEKLYYVIKLNFLSDLISR